MPKKASRPTRAAQMLPEERRKQLLRAGVESFACKGIDGTKHADLARSCKVAVPTVFSYFNNRVALVNAILQEVGSSILENVLEPAQALMSKRLVTNREDLVHQQDVGIGMNGHREAQPDVHSGGVVLDRLFDEVGQP